MVKRQHTADFSIRHDEFCLLSRVKWQTELNEGNCGRGHRTDEKESETRARIEDDLPKASNLFRTKYVEYSGLFYVQR